MQYDAKTPAEYISLLEDDWRKETLLAIRGLLKSRAPEVVEGIKYKLLSYNDEGGDVFCLNAQKNYVSFYVGNAKSIDPDGTLLKGLDVGKGCIRFKKSVSLANTRFDEFLERALAMRKRGEGFGCDT